MWLGARGTSVGFEVCCQVCASTSFADQTACRIAERSQGTKAGRMVCYLHPFSDFVLY